MSDTSQTLIAIYRDEVRRLTADSETVDRRTVIAYAVERADALHKSGELDIDMTEYFSSVFVQIDERDGSATDDVIRSFAAGQFDMQFDGDPALNMVVTLGRGKRKLWRDFTASDLDELDRLRYQNVRSVNAAYEAWRESHDALQPALLEAGTIGDLAEGRAAA